MGSREPLAGWVDMSDLSRDRAGPLTLVARKWGAWFVSASVHVGDSSDQPRRAAQRTAEDAARAMVAEMAAALGGSVAWGNPCPGCGDTRPDVTVDGATQCAGCGMMADAQGVSECSTLCHPAESRCIVDGGSRCSASGGHVWTPNIKTLLVDWETVDPGAVLAEIV